MSKVSLLKTSQWYKPACRIAPFVHSRGYQVLRIVFGLGVLSGMVGYLYTSAPEYLETGEFLWDTSPARLYLGLSVLSVSAYAAVLLLRYFFNSYYFKGLDTLLSHEPTTTGVVYEVAEIVHDAPDDVTAGFFHSSFGHTVLNRVGIVDTKTQKDFLASERTRIQADRITVPDTQMTLVSLVKSILAHDSALATWLGTQGVQTGQLVGAAEWTHREHVARKRRGRWWSKDELSKRSGIGRDFVYGTADTLDRYSKPLTTGEIYHDRARSVVTHPQLVAAVEQQLLQATAGNVLLVGEAGVGKLDIVAAVAERLESGEALGAIMSPQLRLLDTERLLAEISDKAHFEHTLLKLLHEAAAAGNTIMVIDNLPAFAASAAQYGIAVDTLLDEYLAKTPLRVIATSTPATYHETIETNSQLLRYFHVEIVTPPDADMTRRILEALATQHHSSYGVLCTYQALERMAVAADRYVVNGVMPDKAIHLFDEIMIAAGGTNLVSVADVDTYISDTTGVPVGPLKASERSLLLELEATLHERIVGQDAVITAVSSVMRRARADIQASDKPLGSFLFMGPTGVGKTETAKALAAVFFKSEDKMHRFDMSEYSGSDALERLIGTTTSTGSLPTALKEQPYAVVLFDEFEKAATSVHDVFLQILDEGQFTDGRGQRINARNTIIIATSNAGSELIMNWLEAGEAVASKRDTLVDYVISAGIYKPELINRFDEVVLFTPLQQSEQRQVAAQMLEELAVRIQKKGYTLAITDELIDAVLARGYSAEFGARPLQRAMQTIVEDTIAKKVIAGTLAPGDTITLTSEELTSLPS